MGPFVNQNWVVNFANLVYFGPLTFPFFILVLHHQLGQSFRISSYVFSCILDLFFSIFFFYFLYGKKWVATHAPSLQCLFFYIFYVMHPSKDFIFCFEKMVLLSRVTYVTPEHRSDRLKNHLLFIYRAKNEYLTSRSLRKSLVQRVAT